MTMWNVRSDYEGGMMRQSDVVMVYADGLTSAMEPRSGILSILSPCIWCVSHTGEEKRFKKINKKNPGVLFEKVSMLFVRHAIGTISRVCKKIELLYRK